MFAHCRFSIPRDGMLSELLAVRLPLIVAEIFWPFQAVSVPSAASWFNARNAQNYAYDDQCGTYPSMDAYEMTGKTTTTASEQ